MLRYNLSATAADGWGEKKKIQLEFVQILVRSRIVMSEVSDYFHVAHNGEGGKSIYCLDAKLWSFGRQFQRTLSNDVQEKLSKCPPDD